MRSRAEKGYSPPCRSLLLLAGLSVLLLAVPASAQWTELGVPVFLDSSDWTPAPTGGPPFTQAKYGGKPNVLILLDNSLVMNRRPYHSQYAANWYHDNQMTPQGGVGNNQWSWTWVPTIYHVVVQALVGDYQDPDPDGIPATRTPWRMRFPDDGVIGNTATLLDGGRFQLFNNAANFTEPVTDPDRDFFPLCRDGGGAACGALFQFAAPEPDRLRNPWLRRATIYSAGGNGRFGFSDVNGNINAVQVVPNGLLRWSEAGDANRLGSQIRFGLMLLDNDTGDWNDFPYQPWGFWDDAGGAGVDGHLGADAFLSVPFATLYGEESMVNWIQPRACSGFDANCPRGERDTNDLIVATLLDSAETASGQNVVGVGPNRGRRTNQSYINNLGGRAPLSALFRDAQIMIDHTGVGDPMDRCRNTYIVLITAGTSSLAEGRPGPDYPTTAGVIGDLASGQNLYGNPLRSIGVRVKTFVVGINTEDRPVPGGTGQRGADAFLQSLWVAGEAGTIEHANSSPNYIRVDLELGEEDGAAATDKNKNNLEMVRQVRDALRERVFRPILEHETVLRRQPPAVARSRAHEGVGDDVSHYFFVDPVFRVGQFYDSYDSGAPVVDTNVQARTPWQGEIKRRRFQLVFDAGGLERSVFRAEDNAGNWWTPTPDSWELFGLRTNRPIYSAFPPNWNIVNLHPGALGGGDKARLASMMGLKDTTQVDKVLWRLVCPRPRDPAESIGNFPNNADCMPGEVYHGEIALARPPQGAGDEAWRDFVETYEANELTATMAYVSTGDGQVHAFVVDAFGLANQATYERRALWSWVPYSVLHKLRYLPGMTGAFADTQVEGLDYRTKPDPALIPPYDPIILEPGKDFHVDSTPVVRDLYFPAAGVYRRVLAGGTRGGRGYWALDITQASKLQANPAVGYIGEYTPRLERGFVPYDDHLAGTTDERFRWMGSAWSPPLLGHVHLADSGARPGRNPVMVFTGGAAPALRHGEVPTADLTGQFFYMVDLEQKDLLWRDQVDGLCACGTVGCAANKCSLLRHSLTGAPAAEGVGRGSSFKAIWFGNSEGRIFKLVTRDGEYRAVDPLEQHVVSLKPGWGYWATRDGQLDYWDQYAGTGWQMAREPIVVAPAVVKDIDGSTLLVVATGNPDKLTEMHFDDGAGLVVAGRQQWVFVLRDTFIQDTDPLDPNVNVQRARVAGEMASLFDAVCDPTEGCVPPGCCLSRLLLDPGKRVTGTPIVVFGQVFFTANEPVVNAGCMSWNGWLYGMNLLNLHSGLLCDGAGNRVISGWVPGAGGTGGTVTKAVVPEAAADQVFVPTFQDIGLVSIGTSAGSTGFESTGAAKPKCRTESWGQLL